jgi:hypothetical protein
MNRQATTNNETLKPNILRFIIGVVFPIFRCFDFVKRCRTCWVLGAVILFGIFISGTPDSVGLHFFTADGYSVRDHSLPGHELLDCCRSILVSLCCDRKYIFHQSRGAALLLWGKRERDGVYSVVITTYFLRRPQRPNAVGRKSGAGFFDHLRPVSRCNNFPRRPGLARTSRNLCLSRSAATYLGRPSLL